jgi:lipoate synthase
VLRLEGEEMGFMAVFSAPLVRSSFHAAEVFKKANDPQITQIKGKNIES